MSAQRSSNLVGLVFFLAALYLPLGAWLFPPDRRAGQAENRALHQAPSRPRTTEQWLEYPHQIDAFWNDQFGLRQLLIQWNGRVDLALNTLSRNDVIAGKDGWFFYTGSSSVEDFRGTQPFTPKELTEYRVELEARRDWLAAKGIKFLFVVAPNKQAVYPEQLESVVKEGSPHRLDQLLEELRAHSFVQILDLRPALRSFRDQEQLFHKTDTHWTDIGCFRGYQQIQARLAEWFPQLPGRTLADFDRVQAPPFSGDMTAMLGLVGTLSEPRLELVPRPPWREEERPPDGYAPSHQRSASWTGGRGGPRAVVLHDSFFLKPEERDAPPELHTTAFSMLTALAESFSYMYSEWRPDFPREVIDRERPDVVIQETVERSLVEALRPPGPPQP